MQVHDGELPRARQLARTGKEVPATEFHNRILLRPVSRPTGILDS